MDFNFIRLNSRKESWIRGPDIISRCWCRVYKALLFFVLDARGKGLEPLKRFYLLCVSKLGSFVPCPGATEVTGIMGTYQL